MMINQIQVIRENFGTVEQSRSHFNTVGVLRMEVGPLEAAHDYREWHSCSCRVVWCQGIRVPSTFIAVTWQVHS